MFLFFFFKQKTAYEMRISDWSSDVCSSDLPARLGHTHSVGIDIFAGAVAKTCLVDRRDVLGAILQHIGLMAADEALRHGRAVVLARLRDDREIGRAHV